MADANEVIGPLLDLPEVPIVQWPEDADRRWVDARHAAPALLNSADPHRGLTLDDIDAISRWLIHHRPA